MEEVLALFCFVVCLDRFKFVYLSMVVRWIENGALKKGIKTSFFFCLGCLQSTFAAIL